MNHVGRLLDIGHVHGERVAHFRVDSIGHEAAADGGDFHVDLVAVPCLARVLRVPDGVRILVFVLGINFDRLDFVRLQDLREVRLRFGEGLVNHLHFRAGDVDELAILRLRRTDAEVAAFGELVHRDEPFAVGMRRIAPGDDEVTDAVMHRDLIEHDL